jgi:hypothetical protein
LPRRRQLRFRRFRRYFHFRYLSRLPLPLLMLVAIFAMPMLLRHAFAIRRHYFTLSLPQAQQRRTATLLFAPARLMPRVARQYADADYCLFSPFRFSFGFIFSRSIFRRSLIFAISASAERLAAGADFLFAFLRQFAAIYAIFS